MGAALSREQANRCFPRRLSLLLLYYHAGDTRVRKWNRPYSSTINEIRNRLFAPRAHACPRGKKRNTRYFSWRIICKNDRYLRKLFSFESLSKPRCFNSIVEKSMAILFYFLLISRVTFNFFHFSIKNVYIESCEIFLPPLVSNSLINLKLYLPSRKI